MRVLAIGDYHDLPEQCWERIPELVRTHRADVVLSLGDVDGRIDVQNLKELEVALSRMGVELSHVRGNHCQWWLDAYRNNQRGVDEFGNGALPLDKSTFEYLSATPLEQRLDHIVARHTLPVGPQKSGPHAPDGIWPEHEQRPDLWRYSFNGWDGGTPRETCYPSTSLNELEAYNPLTMFQNFSWLAEQDALLLLMGHEHLAKERTLAHGEIHGGKVISQETDIRIADPAIVQAPSFHQGGYVVIDILAAGYDVQFRCDDVVRETMMQPHSNN